MKILHVTRENISDLPYGLGKSVSPLLKHLSNEGHTLEYLWQGVQKDDRVPLHEILYEKIVSMFFANIIFRGEPNVFLEMVLERMRMGATAARFVAKNGVTHVHCHDPFIAAGYRWFSWMHPSIRKVAWGITEHAFGCYAQTRPGIRLSAKLERRLRNIERKIVLSANWVIFPSHSGLSQAGIDLQISLIPYTWHAVHHPRPEIKRYSREEARERLGWKDDIFYIVSVGQLIEMKQFPLLIEACSRLRMGVNYHIVILGSGDRGPIDRCARQFGVEKIVSILETKDVGLYLHASDLYVSTSATESFGIANLEAILSGIPAVCTSVGAVPEILGDGALLVSPDVESVSQAIQMIIDDPALRYALAKKGELRGNMWPEFDSVAKRYEEIYRSAELSS